MDKYVVITEDGEKNRESRVILASTLEIHDDTFWFLKVDRGKFIFVAAFPIDRVLAITAVEPPSED